MNSDSNVGSPGGAQAGKSPGKRAHRANRNRPVLLTENGTATTGGQSTQAIEEAARPAIPVAVEEQSSTSEQTAPRRRAGFFANIGKATATPNQAEADPQAVRLARAMRGKPASAPKEQPVSDKKQPAAESRSNATAVRPRPAGGFKMKYIIGMMIYLLVADFLGVYVTNFMTANHLDATLFIWGPIVGKTSTLVFLAILVIILVVMARFDLLPRSFSAMNNASSASRGTSSTAKTKTTAPTFDTRASQPTIKQGVQGENDNLYREYRENQRYFQRRDRKR